MDDGGVIVAQDSLVGVIWALGNSEIVWDTGLARSGL